MALSTLEAHAPAQEDAISNISSRLDPTTDWCKDWLGFKTAHWGETTFERREDVIRETPNPLEAIHILPDPPPTSHLIASVPKDRRKVWNMQSAKILVRSDYEEAEKAAVSSLGKPSMYVFAVGGQPGIGKSMFLLWLLMRRLALKLPTALQVDKAYALLFHDDGVSEFNLDTHPSFQSLWFDDPLSRIWVLTDSNPHLPEPAPIFIYASPFFIVDAASPRTEHRGWLSKRGYEEFYMNTWSMSEIIQVRPYLGKGTHTERQLWYLHDEFGASPRALAEYAAHPGAYENRLHQQIEKMNAESLPQIFRDPGSFQPSHYIVTIQPSPTNRGRTQNKIVSRRVFEILWEKHIYSRINVMQDFHDLFVASPITATSAGWVFELRMHQLLRKARTVQLFPIRGHRADVNFIYQDYTASKKKIDPTDLQLVDSEEHDIAKGAKLKMGHYYRPKAVNFPAIDSLLLIHPLGEPSPILLMFQVTLNKKTHDAKLSGLRKIDELDLPSDVRKYYIAVTPEGIWPKITVPISYLDGGQAEGEDEDEDEEEDEGEDEEEDEEMDQDVDVSPGRQFQVFNYPVRLDELFAR